CRSMSLNLSTPMVGRQLPAATLATRWAGPSRSRNLHRLVIFPQLVAPTLSPARPWRETARVTSRREGTMATTLLFRVVLSTLVVLVGATPTLALVLYPLD